MSKEDRFPLIIRTESGRIEGFTYIDEKGMSKSVEQGELWTLHNDTGKLLPLKGQKTFLRLLKKPGWIEAVFADQEGNEKTEKASAEKEDLLEREDGVLLRLQKLIRERKKELPEGSYTTHLFTKGIDKIKKKLGEEAVELILSRGKNEIIYESADLIYHFLVFIEESGIDFSEVLEELESRE